MWNKWYMIVFVYAPIFLELLLFLQFRAITQKMKREHKDYKSEKHSFIEGLSSVFYITLLMFIPLVNIGIYMLAFSKKDEIVERVLERTKE